MPMNMTSKGKDVEPYKAPKRGKPPGNNANGGEATRKSLDLMSIKTPKDSNVRVSRHDKGDEMTCGRGTRSPMGKGFHQNGQKGGRGSR